MPRAFPRPSRRFGREPQRLAGGAQARPAAIASARLRERERGDRRTAQFFGLVDQLALPIQGIMPRSLLADLLDLVGGVRARGWP